MKRSPHPRLPILTPYPSWHGDHSYSRPIRTKKTYDSPLMSGPTEGLAVHNMPVSQCPRHGHVTNPDMFSHKALLVIVSQCTTSQCTTCVYLGLSSPPSTGRAVLHIRWVFGSVTACFMIGLLVYAFLNESHQEEKSHHKCTSILNRS